MAFGTPRLRLDLVGPDATLPAKVGPRAIPSDEVHAFSFPERARPGTFATVPVIGPIFQFDYLNRNNEVTTVPRATSLPLLTYSSGGGNQLHHLLHVPARLRKRNNNPRRLVSDFAARASRHRRPGQAGGLRVVAQPCYGHLLQGNLIDKNVVVMTLSREACL
jgi:hypothetical protein